MEAKISGKKLGGVRLSPSTVGRNSKAVKIYRLKEKSFQDCNVSVFYGNSLDFYEQWDAPQVIVSDGAYGVLGFDGDTLGHHQLVSWYEPHIKCWSKQATSSTTLWFWNSEIGWATVHPILEKYGWKYMNCNIWNKGKAHLAGNVNTQRIRRFPVVTEVCAHYVYSPMLQGMTVQDWMHQEWRRTKLPFSRANEACGVADAATRKYLTKGHLWYPPPAAAFLAMASYANRYGAKTDLPYFSLNGKTNPTASDWDAMRATFSCPHGVTNVWDRKPLKGGERVRTRQGKIVHLNQKPLDLMTQIIMASSRVGQVVWEPFGGLFSASLAAKKISRRAFSAEIDKTYFAYGIRRFSEADQLTLVS